MKRVIGGRAPLLLIAITAETTVARVVPPPDFVHNQYGDLCKGLGHYGPFPNFYVGGTPEYDWKPVGGIADDFERHGYCSTNPTAGGQQVTFGHTRDAVLRCALRQSDLRRHSALALTLAWPSLSRMADTTTASQLLHLSLALGGQLQDADGLRLGRVDDLIVRLGSDDYPPVTGALATIAGRAVFVPAELITAIAPKVVTIRKSPLDLQPFSRRPQEVLLKEDVLDRQLINVDGARLVRTNEIEIARLEGWYRVVGVDTGPRGLFRRLIPRRFAGAIRPGSFLDWASVEPFTGHVPTVRLRIPHPKLARLHPAELADLVEAASHREGGEILEAVRADAEREADVFEELDTQHQVEFIEEKSDVEAAAVLARMESDDAADLVNDLPEQRREDVIALLPPAQRRRVRALLGYDSSTAGGLMSPDFICVYSQATREEALERIRRSTGSPDSITWIYVMNQHRRLKGAIQVVDLVRAESGAAVGDIARPAKHVRPHADLEEVARLMTDYDLTVVPVVDDEEQILGVITVDDVLELVLPRGWRRNFGMLGDD